VKNKDFSELVRSSSVQKKISSIKEIYYDPIEIEEKANELNQ
jgi:hypothetical protein